MTPKSVSRTRLLAWLTACEAFGYADTAAASGGLTPAADGVVLLRAVRPASRPDGSDRCSLTVREVWEEGDDPDSDHRLEADGCHLVSANWHLQIGTEASATAVERLDVVDDPDDAHPRIHRHPLGSPNPIRVPAELPPPQSWLHTSDTLVELFLEPTDQEDVED